GSIVPLGPEVEYATEKSTAPVVLRIYRGADSNFNLYEDEGDTYDYEKGAHSIIPIHWNESTATLTIGDREGKYPGMPVTHSFRLVLVGKDRGAGAAMDETGVDLQYNGSAVSTVL